MMTYMFSLVVLLVSAGSVVYFFFPQVLIDVTNSQFASAADLEKRSIKIEGDEVYYFASKTSDKKETLVLVHGMGDDKNSFLQSAAELSKHYNLILPDLLGHGENDRDINRDYSINAQSDFLKTF